MVEGKDSVTVSANGTSVEPEFIDGAEKDTFVVRRSSNSSDSVQAIVKLINLTRDFAVIGANHTVFNDEETTLISLSTFCASQNQTSFVVVTVPNLPSFKYKTKCELEPKGQGRDLSAAFALFFIAIMANYIIIKHVPALNVIESLPEESQ